MYECAGHACIRAEEGGVYIAITCVRPHTIPWRPPSGADAPGPPTTAQNNNFPELASGAHNNARRRTSLPGNCCLRSGFRPGGAVFGYGGAGGAPPAPVTPVTSPHVSPGVLVSSSSGLFTGMQKESGRIEEEGLLALEKSSALASTSQPF